MKQALALLAAGLLASAAAPEGEAAKKDKGKLEGTWKVLVAEKDGEQKGKAELRKVRVIISAGKMTIDDESRETRTREEMSFKLDPGKSPKEIDFRDKDGALTNKGIYSLEDSQLRICYGEPGKDRPTTFATKPESGLVLLVLRREKL
jgi:uncharacterized protein (TIGR03067 family)